MSSTRIGKERRVGVVHNEEDLEKIKALDAAATYWREQNRNSTKDRDTYRDQVKEKEARIDVLMRMLLQEQQQRARLEGQLQMLDKQYERRTIAELSPTVTVPREFVPNFDPRTMNIGGSGPVYNNAAIDTKPWWKD